MRDAAIRYYGTTSWSMAQWVALHKTLDPRTKEIEKSYERNVNQRRKDVVQNALKSGYLKVIDKELILTAQEEEAQGRCKNLSEVLRISLPRWHIQLLDSAALSECTLLTICNLSSCYVRDITAFRSCASLLKLDLSNNQIVEVPEISFWSSLSSLRVLYLHGNAISDKECAGRINGCVQLHILTLYNTPYSLLAGYRHNVVNSILSLKALDRHVISDEEVVENLHLCGKFKSASASFKLQLYQPLPQATLFEEELRTTYRLLLDVDRILAENSPVLIIQRYVRGWLTRRALKGERHSSIKPNQRCVHSHMEGPEAQPTSSVEGPEAAQPTSSVEGPEAAQPTSSVEGPEAAQPTCRAESATEHGSHLHPPPPTPSASLPYQEGGAWGGEGHALFRKKYFPQKKRILHVDLRGDHHLEQNTSEAHLFQARSRSQTPRSRPNSHKAQGRGGEGTQVSGAQFAEQLGSLPTEGNCTGGQARVEGMTFHDIQVDCHSVPIQAVDLAAEMSRGHQQNGKLIRDTEREITRLLSNRVRRSFHGQPALTKDQLLFTRAYVSMTVSAVRTLENLGKVKRKNDELVQKAVLVARLKEDRLCRAENIAAYRHNLKETIHTWKDHHVETLLKKKKALVVERNLLTTSHASRHHREAVRAQLLKEEREFEAEFGMQNAAIGGAMAHEDKKVARDVYQRGIKAMVEERREAGERGVALVKGYLRQREAHLLQKNSAFRRGLEAKMQEITSQRQSDAKARVAKGKSHKAAAKEAVLLTKGVVDHASLDPPTPGTPLGLTPGHSYRSRPLITQVHRSKVGTRPAMASPADDARAEEVNIQGHFPVLESPDTSCLMFDMLKPTTVLYRNPWQPWPIPIGT